MIEEKYETYLVRAEGTDNVLVELKALLGLGVLIVKGGALTLDELRDSSLQVEVLLLIILIIIFLHGVLEILEGSSGLQLAGLLLVAGATVALLLGILLFLIILITVILIIGVFLEVKAGRSANDLQSGAGRLGGVLIVLELGSLIRINGSHADTELDSMLAQDIELINEHNLQKQQHWELQQPWHREEPGAHRLRQAGQQTL
jgi:hypothetical protein